MREWSLALAVLTGAAAACSDRPPKKARPSAVAASASAPRLTPPATPSSAELTAPPASGDVDPACATNGCLREVTKVGDYGLEKIAPYLAKGVRVTTGYSVYTLRFVTDGAESTAVATIPFDASTPERGWDIGVNDHGTIGVDDPCAPSRSLLGVGHAGWFGARGMIGVAPDYPGLGTAGIHPYLVSRSEGAAALDSVRAARALAVHLGLRTSGRAVLVGLSQGGHATLAAAALHKTYAPELDVRAFAAAAPASAWASHWSMGARANGWGIPVHAMLFYAWSKRYAWPADKPLWAPSFAPEVDRLFATQCTWAPSPPTILTSVPKDATQVFDATLLAEYRANQWATYAFVKQAFDENAVAPYAQTAPLRIYQGDTDTTVPKVATDELVAALRAGGVEVDYVVVPGADHLTTAFGVYSTGDLRSDDAYAWLRSKLDPAEP
ncbi:MAG: lipase family protein [Polyangiaceae bacterium]